MNTKSKYNANKRVNHLLTSGYIRNIFEECDYDFIITKDIIDLCVLYLLQTCDDNIFLLVGCRDRMRRKYKRNILKCFDMHCKKMKQLTIGGDFHLQYNSLLYVQTIKWNAQFIQSYFSQQYAQKLINNNYKFGGIFCIGGSERFSRFEAIGSPIETMYFADLILLVNGGDGTDNEQQMDGYCLSAPYINCVSNLVYDDMFKYGLIALEHDTNNNVNVRNMTLNEKMYWKNDIPKPTEKIHYNSSKLQLSIVTCNYLFVYDGINIQFFNFKTKEWAKIDSKIKGTGDYTLYFDDIDNRLYFINTSSNDEKENLCLNVNNFAWNHIAKNQIFNGNVDAYKYDEGIIIKRLTSKLLIIGTNGTRCYDINKNKWIKTSDDDNALMVAINNNKLMPKRHYIHTIIPSQ